MACESPRTLTNKEKYGEVFTPVKLVEEMHHTLFHEFYMPNNILKNVFEPGAGKGVFYDIFQNKHKSFTGGYYVMNEINPARYSELMKVAQKSEKDKIGHVDVAIDDVHNLDFESSAYYQNFDLVLGNLPFNGGGKKMTPNTKLRNNLNTNSKASAIWTSITRLMFQKVLNYGGFYYCIIPAIWMKEDRANIYDLFCKHYTIHFIKCYDCYQAHKMFDYNCHTPICYVLVEKKQRLYCDLSTLYPKIINRTRDAEVLHAMYVDQKQAYSKHGTSKDAEKTAQSYINRHKYDKIHESIAGRAAMSVMENTNIYFQDIDYNRIAIMKCYDESQSKYVLFPHAFHTCLPTKHYDLFSRSTLYFITWHKHIEHSLGSTSNMTLFHIIKKVSFMRPSVLEAKLGNQSYTGDLQDATFTDCSQYKIITGATILKQNGNTLGLNGFIGTLPGCHQGQKKIVLPHKRYLRVLRDYSGTYGLYGRDMYVFICKTDEELDALANFLELDFVKQMVEEGFSIRMNFIEKYVYQYLPNIYHNQFDSNLYLKSMCQI